MSKFIIRGIFLKVFWIPFYLCFFLSISLLNVNAGVFKNDYFGNNKVSVIIPVYNVEKYIAKCLQSVVDQTYKNLEIICIDDCGTDKSMQVVEQYAKKDARFRIIHHEGNLGLAEVRNTGVVNAEGDFVFFLDSDDYIHPNTIEKCVQKQNETNSDIVVAKIEIFISEDAVSDNEIKKKYEARKKRFNYNMQNYQRVTMNNLQESLESIPFVSWGKLYKRDFLLKNDIWHIHQHITYEDIGFFIKILCNMPSIAAIQDENVGVHYRMRKESITDLQEGGDMNTKIVIEDAIKYIGEHFENATADKLTELVVTHKRYQKFLNMKEIL